jgi:hypothetical protein
MMWMLWIKKCRFFTFRARRAAKRRCPGEAGVWRAKLAAGRVSKRERGK